MVALFHTLIFDPLYNALVFLIEVVPGHEVGLAVILLTILVKILLFPLAKQAIKTQVVLRSITPQLEELKKKYKDDQQEQVKQTLALYKENNIHPLSGILTLFIQIPIIIGLYWVFFRGGLPVLDESLLYAFTPRPEAINMMFLGVVDIGGRSIVLAVLAGLSQFIHARISIQPPLTSGNTLKDDLSRSMHMQMRYVLPVIVGVFAYTISAAVALYWVTGNIFTIGQELLVRRRFRDTQ